MTYNVDAAVDLRKATLASVLQPLEAGRKPKLQGIQSLWLRNRRRSSGRVFCDLGGALPLPVAFFAMASFVVFGKSALMGWYR